MLIGLSRTCPQYEDSDDQESDNDRIQRDIFQVVFEELSSDIPEIAEFRTGSQHPPYAGDNAHGQVRLNAKNIRLQKTHNGSEQFEQNDDQEEIVHRGERSAKMNFHWPNGQI